MTRYSVRRFLPWFSPVGTIDGCSEQSSPVDAWIGKTFLLDTPAFTASKWTKPTGFGGDLRNYVPQVLLGVEAAPNDGISVTVATALDGAQDMCTPTAQATVDNVEYPASELTVGEFPMHIISREEKHPSAAHAVARNVKLKDILPEQEDASTAQMDATLDAADTYPLFWQAQEPTKESVCELFACLEVPCETCPHNGEPFCLSNRVVQLVASPDAQPLIKLSASDIGPACP